MPSFHIPSGALSRALIPALSLCALGFDPQPAGAQTAAAKPVDIPEVVTSATRIPTPESELGSSVTVITREEIEARQQRTAPDALLLSPGLNVVQTGGPGGQSSVFIRGTNANQTKVFIDGIDVSDPSSPAGFDFAHILTFDIRQMEVLRGPQSGLYGANAIGGVVNIVTEQGSGPGHATAKVEAGSFNSFNQSVKFAGSTDWLNYHFGFAHFAVGGTQATPPDLVPANRNLNLDSYDNRTASMRLGAALGDQFGVGLVSHFIETTLSSTGDDFLGPQSWPGRGDNQQLFTRGFAHLSLFDGRFEETLGVAYTKYARNYLDPNYAPVVTSLYGGDRVKVDYQGNLRLVEGEILTFGAEREENRVDNLGGLAARNGDAAGFAQLQSSLGGRFFNALSVRYDSNDQFGSAVTYRLAPAFLIPETGTKLKGSVGTGFKAPTLDELYNDYPAFNFFGNPDLLPERSIGADVGFEQTLLPGRIALGATYYANTITNLIDINSTFTSYANIGHARTAGIEAFMSLSPWDGFAIRADYTYTVAKNEITQLDLLRRPRDKLSLTATLQATPSLLLSATMVYVGPSLDVSRSGAETNVPVNGYTIVNLAGSYDLGHGVSAFARVDNLLDRRYQNPLGFQRPGLGLFGGLKATLGPEGFL